MKISLTLLRERCGLIQPKFAKHLDLSHCNIVTLDGLKHCISLETLILRYNSISIVPSIIGSLPELWKLDLSHNLICSLEGLLKIRCIGTLVLSFNNLTWLELRKLQHMTILDLRLVGNPALEKDPYYRRHVIDSLPNVWMLDGILVTAAEREQISRFFKNSEILERPVRHKLKPNSRFTPTHLKDLSRQAVPGKNGLQLLSRFSLTEKHTLRTDRRRVQYLAEIMQHDLALQRSYWSMVSRSGSQPPDASCPLPAYLQSSLAHSSSKYHTDEGNGEEEEGDPAPRGFGHVPLLEKLLIARSLEVEKCNMLLLLLVAGLEFSLPLALVEETLYTANLGCIWEVDCGTLLQLPHEDLLLTCSLLLSCVIIDRGEGEQGGLYKRLFVALYVVLSNLLRTTHGYPKNFQLKYMSPAIHRSLLAAEVVQLMCLVPTFINLIDRDQGVLDVVAIATQNPHIKDLITDIMWNSEEYDVEEVANALLHFVRNNIEHSNYELLELEPGLLPYNTPLSTVAIPTHRNIENRAKSGVASRRARSKGAVRVPALGDVVCLPRQRRGRIIGLHQEQLALIQISAHPVTSLKEACGEYVYVDMQFMGFDSVAGLWKQQHHVQEYPSETRLSGKVEKCYSVISNEDYCTRYERGGGGGETAASATSEIGEPYYVHENRQLQLEVDEECSQYIATRPPLPSTPGLTEGVFAAEEDVQVRLTPQREPVPVMKKVLEHATQQSISKQEMEMRASGHVSAVDVNQPSRDIKVIPLTPTKILSSMKKEHLPREVPVPQQNLHQVPITQQLPTHSKSLDLSARPRSSRPATGSAWSIKSSARPNTRRGESPNTRRGESADLMTKQKSLPDVSGISLFAYSMGRVGFIKPPDITDKLATCRAKDKVRGGSPRAKLR